MISRFTDSKQTLHTLFKSLKRCGLINRGANYGRNRLSIGMLLFGVDHLDLIDHLAETKTPAVIINGMDRTMRLSSISPDYHYGAWRATRHLLDMGHRDIVHVTHPYSESVR